MRRGRPLARRQHLQRTGALTGRSPRLLIMRVLLDVATFFLASGMEKRRTTSCRLMCYRRRSWRESALANACPSGVDEGAAHEGFRE